jgi:hypothetical protein
MRGMKWITEMEMEMVLILTVVLMETLEGGMEEPFRGDSGGVPPPPPIFSDGSWQTLYFGVFDLSTTSLHDP